MQFVAWNCNGCSIAPLADYASNPVFQELPDEDTYFLNSDEQIYLDLRHSKGYTNKLEKLRRDESDLLLKIEFKNALQKKMRLRVWGYLQGEYLYLLTNCGLTMNYKTHTIEKEKYLAC